MRFPSTRYRLVLAAVIAAACGSPVEVPPDDTQPSVLTGPGPFNLSNVVTLVGATDLQGSTVSDPRAFLSLPPGSLPGRTEVTLRIWRTGAEVHRALVNGGLDPVAIAATPGDTLTVTATGPDVSPSIWVMTVPPARPPRLVRTEPPRDKRDVPLNLRIILVFSEPITPASLRPEAIGVRTRTTEVPATLLFGNADQTVVWLEPVEALASATEYLVSVSAAVTDMDGEALDAPVTVSFTTQGDPPSASPYITVSDAASGHAFVSIGPGRLKGTGSVTIRNVRSGVVIKGPLIDGSLDPVAILAATDDVLELDILDRAGRTQEWRAVPSQKAPVVVRTGGLAGAQDVVLNPRFEVVFSEPVLLTPQRLQLFSGTLEVAGQIAAADPAQTTLVFEPAQRLDPGTSYRFVVGEGVPDLQGATTSETVELPFVTADRVPFEGLTFVREGQILLIEDEGVIQLTRSLRGAAHNRPAWSADGARLAFEGASDVPNFWNDPDIFVRNMADSTTTRLTAGGGFEPTWSPDGGAIAYSGMQDGSAAIMRIATGSGASAEILLNRPGYDAQPAWSPDGKSIVFVSDWRAYDFLFDLYSVDAGGGDIKTIYAGSFFPSPDPVANLRLSFDPAWSPDGRQVAFAACTHGYDDCFPSAVAVVDVPPAEGPDARWLVAHGDGIRRPTWSPDGTTIVYSARDCPTCVPSLMWVKPEGGGGGLVLTNASSPAWRPVPPAP